MGTETSTVLTPGPKFFDVFFVFCFRGLSKLQIDGLCVLWQLNRRHYGHETSEICKHLGFLTPRWYVINKINSFTGNKFPVSIYKETKDFGGIILLESTKLRVTFRKLRRNNSVGEGNKLHFLYPTDCASRATFFKNKSVALLQIPVYWVQHWIAFTKLWNK